MTLQQAAEKYAKSNFAVFRKPEQDIKIFLAGAEFNQQEVDRLKAIVEKQEREYILNGTIQEWREYADRTKAIIEENKKEIAALREKVAQLNLTIDYYEERKVKMQEEIDRMKERKK